MNIYPEGAGIAAHTDSHLNAGPVLLSLSLGSPVLMTFVQPLTKASAPVLLPPRSLLRLEGEARFLWTHG